MATITANATGGNWSATTAWTGGVAPGTNDDVILGAGSGNITLNASATNLCKTLDASAYTGTLTLSSAQTFTISGNKLLLSSGMTLVLSGTIGTFQFTDAIAETVAITTGGLTLPNITIGFGLTSSSSTFQLQDNCTLGTTSTWTHTCGTFSTNNKTVSWGAYSANNTNTKVITLGSSSITCTNTGAVWTVNATGTTLNAGTSTITCSGNVAQFAGGASMVYNNVSLTGSGIAILNNSSTFNNLNRTGTAVVGDGLNMGGNPTVSGVLTLSGNSNINRLAVANTTVGTAASFIANGSFSLSYVDFQDITASGTAGTWTGTQLGDCLGNTNITFPASTPRYWVGGAGSWSSTSNWSGSSGGASGSIPPLPQDDAIFDANSFSAGGQAVSASMPRLGRNIDFSAATFAPAISMSTNSNIYGSLALIAGTTTSLTFKWVFMGRSSLTINTAGITLSNSINITAPGATYTLLSNFVTSGVTSSISLNNGTLNTNGFTVTTGVISGSNANVRGLTLGSSTINLIGTGTILSFGSVTNFTMSAGTSTIVATDNSSTSKTFAMAGKVLNNITVTSGGTGAFIFTMASSTINTLTCTGGVATLTFPASSTINLTAPVNIAGTSGNLVTINSSVSTTQAVLASPNFAQNLNFVSVKDINATGPGWFAQNSTNTSNNTGITFAATYGIYETEAVALTEVVSLSSILLQISKTESATVTEVINPSVLIGISVDPSNPIYYINGVKIV